mmetsp:Transcript_20974/g.43745  ORF Transcript_20974/g.43745 Transcript_20974/m.43745 type:complete len:220 (+) Transcript_20974:2405-3064(+)
MTGDANLANHVELDKPGKKRSQSSKNETQSAGEGGEKEGNSDDVTGNKTTTERTFASQINATARLGANQIEQTRAADQPTCSFHCRICSRDFVFTNVKTAGACFAKHVDYCDPKRKRRKLSKAEYVTYNSDLPDNETQLTPDEELSEASRIDLDLVKPGSRVVVTAQMKTWNATVRRYHTKNNEPGFMIHYDGSKRRVEKWVPISNVLNFVGDSAGCGE